ncbi:hypothetical protein V7152_18985 [Neobacillus drentensis]|uniref:hypothetical protein n=1 Tax=Neobacillus drentensis TaxID=220684 RepID=UPI002FFE91DD
MGDIIQLAVKSFEKLGFTPVTMLILIFMVLLFTWLFKQVTLKQEKLLEEEKVETQDALNQYCNIYKTLLLYKEEIGSRDTLMIEFTNSIPFLKKETCDKIEDHLFKDQHIDECISHIKEQILILRKVQDEVYLRLNRGTASGKILFIIRIVELISQPIFITTVAFVTFLYFMFIGFQAIVSPKLIFINNLTIFLNLFLLLSFIAAIVDKRSKYSVKNIGSILAYFITITVLIELHNIIASAFAFLLLIVFTTVYNPKTNNGR